MCVGHYSNSWLTIDAFLLSLHIRLMDSVRFVIDTGSEITILAPQDAVRIGLDFSSLKNSDHQTRGIGGIANTLILEDVAIAFEERMKNRVEMHIEPLDSIEVGDPRTWSLPSLLGQDILVRRFDFTTQSKTDCRGCRINQIKNKFCS